MVSKNKRNKNENTGNERDESDVNDEAADEARDHAAAIVDDLAPDGGFRRVNPLDGERLYFKPREEGGSVVRGVLLGRFQRAEEEGDDGPKFYYQIRATEPCESCQTGDGEVVTAQFGQIVQIDERSGMRDLVPYATKSVPHEVYLKAVQKVKLQGKRGTFWRWDVYAKPASTSTLAKIADAVKALASAPAEE